VATLLVSQAASLPLSPTYSSSVVGGASIRSAALASISWCSARRPVPPARWVSCAIRWFWICSQSTRIASASS
jgi:hypothetical protein